MVKIHTCTEKFQFTSLATSLKRVINREQEHWTKIVLSELTTQNIGWGKAMKETLTKYNLPTCLQKIKSHKKNEWANKVKTVIEKRNTDRLIQHCHKIDNGENKRKTKTAHIVDQIEDPTYQRTPLKELMKSTKQETKTILIARFGMLECGKNYKGTKSITCGKCNEYDDEIHRINYCYNFRWINYFDHDTKVNFYSDDIDTLRTVLPTISEVWNVRNANG